MGLVLVSVAMIPVGVLVSAARDSKLRRRSNFRVRFAWFVVLVSLPELLIGLASAVGLLQGAPLAILLLGLFWGMALLPLAPLILFHGPGFDPGPSDEGGEGPDSGDDRPTPTPPLGGLPLPDAEQSSKRLRGPRPRPAALTPPRRSCDPSPGPSRIPAAGAEPCPPPAPPCSFRRPDAAAG